MVSRLWHDYRQQSITCRHATAATNFEHYIAWPQESFGCLPEKDSARIKDQLDTFRQHNTKAVNTIEFKFLFLF
jgi:hypothetical protein